MGGYLGLDDRGSEMRTCPKVPSESVTCFSDISGIRVFVFSLFWLELGRAKIPEKIETERELDFPETDRACTGVTKEGRKLVATRTQRMQQDVVVDSCRLMFRLCIVLFNSL